MFRRHHPRSWHRLLRTQGSCRGMKLRDLSIFTWPQVPSGGGGVCQGPRGVQTLGEGWCKRRWSPRQLFLLLPGSREDVFYVVIFCDCFLTWLLWSPNWLPISVIIKNNSSSHLSTGVPSQISRHGSLGSVLVKSSTGELGTANWAQLTKA